MTADSQAEREAAVDAARDELLDRVGEFIESSAWLFGPVAVPLKADALIDAARAAGRGEAAERIEALAGRWESQQGNYARNATPGDRDAALAAAAAVRICARELRALLSEGAE